jgi:hypothetical protein
LRVADWNRRKYSEKTTRLDLKPKNFWIINEAALYAQAKAVRTPLDLKPAGKDGISKFLQPAPASGLKPVGNQI